MQLVKTQPEFQTYELLEAMIKVSEVQKERSKNASHDNAFDLWLVSFNMGRQVGHTTAIHEYALNHKDENILVVCHNHCMIKYYNDSYNHHENIDYTTANTSTILPMNPNKYDRIFFDVVPIGDARNFLSNIEKARKPFDDVNLSNTVKSVVCVGSI